MKYNAKGRVAWKFLNCSKACPRPFGSGLRKRRNMRRSRLSIKWQMPTLSRIAHHACAKEELPARETRRKPPACGQACGQRSAQRKPCGARLFARTAHPPGDLLLPLCDNSPWVAARDQSQGLRPLTIPERFFRQAVKFTNFLAKKADLLFCAFWNIINML